MRSVLQSMNVDAWVLPALLIWPLVAAVLVRVFGRDGVRDEQGMEAPSGGPDARVLTLIALAIEALLGLALWAVYDAAGLGWQARVDVPWLPESGAAISLGVDGLSLPFVVMTALLLPLTLLGSWNNVRTRTSTFGALILVLTTGLMGVFVTLDLLAFYFAWELMLVPTYFLVSIWGVAGQSRAGLRYVLFTLVGSLLMLVAIMSLWAFGGARSFHVDDLSALVLSSPMQLWMFAAFFLAFGVKSALVPVHSWLPDAQSAAPTFASVTLGIKVGAYGLLRFAIPMFPAAALEPRVRSVILVLSVVTILYGALLAMAQRDLKRMVAYSAISHLGFIMLGCFALTQQSVQGAVLSIINSGVSTSALFLLVGMLEDRRGTTALADFGGIARAAPLFSVMLTLVMLANIGLPGTNGFIGEFLVLVGAYAEQPVLTVIATSGVIFAAAYGLRALQSVLFERGTSATSSTLTDLTRRELIVMCGFAVAIVTIGVAPNGILLRTEGATRTLIETARFGPNAAASVPRVPVKQ